MRTPRNGSMENSLTRWNEIDDLRQNLPNEACAAAHVVDRHHSDDHPICMNENANSCMKSKLLIRKDRCAPARVSWSFNQNSQQRYSVVCISVDVPFLILFIRVRKSKKKKSNKNPQTTILFCNLGNVPGRPQGGRHGMVFGQIPVSTTSVPLVPGSTPFTFSIFLTIRTLQELFVFHFKSICLKEINSILNILLL